MHRSKVKVGIIGGMGPEATVDLVTKIVASTNADCDQDHIHLIVDINTEVPDRTAFLLGKGENPLPFLFKSVSMLENAGAEALCMACNTAHFFQKDIEKASKLPFISMVDSAVDELAVTFRPPIRVGIAGTKGVFIGHIYDKPLINAGYEVFIPPDSVMANLMEIIYGIKSGKLTEMLVEANLAFDWFVRNGANVLLLACTELPLLLPHITVDIPVIDSTMALAKRVVEFANGKVNSQN
jgi:aspartate racemase